MKFFKYSLSIILILAVLAGCNLKEQKIIEKEVSQTVSITPELAEALADPQRVIRLCGKEESQVLNKYIKSRYGGNEAYILLKVDQDVIDKAVIIVAYVQGMQQMGSGEKRLGYSLSEMEQGIKTNGRFLKKYESGDRTTLVFGAKDLDTLDKVLKEFFDRLNLSQNTAKEKNGSRTIVFIPPNPDKGFHWGYYLVIPSDRHKSENQNHKRYLMIDTNNTPETNNYDELKKQTYNELEKMKQYSMQAAEKLWLPMIYPVFPRPSVKSYTFKGETNKLLTHSFDRDSATLHLKLKEPSVKKLLIEQFNEAGYDANKFIRMDLQLAAMMDHAIDYLNANGNPVQKDKAFLCGYSSSGTFTDRFSALNPERVNAVVSGATLDDMLLPVSEYRGEKLVFPIGTYDYKDITGKQFSLEKHNQAARLIYMGEEDGGNHNTVTSKSCYGDSERNIITRLWGIDVLPRAGHLTELYGQYGGKGIFIIDKGIGHSYSPEMKQYILDFFKENRDNDAPVYPTPKDPDQLKYTLYN